MPQMIWLCRQILVLHLECTCVEVCVFENFKISWCSLSPHRIPSIIEQSKTTHEQIHVDKIAIHLIRSGALFSCARACTSNTISHFNVIIILNLINKRVILHVRKINRNDSCRKVKTNCQKYLNFFLADMRFKGFRKENVNKKNARMWQHGFAKKEEDEEKKIFFNHRSLSRLMPSKC